MQLSLQRGGSNIDILGRYRLLKPLGEGRFGKVYLVRDKRSGNLFALKESKDPTYFRQLLEEAQNVLLLNHPNLVKLYHYYLSKDKKKIYLLYEYCNGGDLKSYIENLKRPLEFEEAFNILYQIAEGLAYLHNLGYIHFDIKPENILLKSPNIWKLGDFGLIKTRGFSGILDIKGTVGYIAPEVFRGEIHRSSDIFSLGCLLHYMLTGSHPFVAETPQEELSLNKKGLVNIPQRLPADFKPIFTKMVKINPFLRYRTAGELLAELKKYREVKKW